MSWLLTLQIHVNTLIIWFNKIWSDNLLSIWDLVIQLEEPHKTCWWAPCGSPAAAFPLLKESFPLQLSTNQSKGASELVCCIVHSTGFYLSMDVELCWVILAVIGNLPVMLIIILQWGI